MWDVAQYRLFESERARPFWDLVGNIPFRTWRTAETVVDLGCGTGELTAELRRSHCRNAHVLGIDSSPEMLKRAESVALPGKLDLQQCDIADWRPTEPVDIILSNAALHWLPDHEQLFPRLVSSLNYRGTLAVQMPNRFRAPSQQAIDETIDSGPWRDRLKNIGLHKESVLPTETYARLLLAAGLAVDAWETTYYHILHGENASLEWLKGTALRPLLAALTPDEQASFQAALSIRLDAAYPPKDGITIFPMQRLFIVATRRGSQPLFKRRMKSSG